MHCDFHLAWKTRLKTNIAYVVISKVMFIKKQAKMCSIFQINFCLGRLTILMI